MPIPPPTLDKRKFQDLVDELRGRISIHNPEWTNFNRSDPGITILEVAAFLVENDIYVANQIPERNRRKFLNLLGVPLHPAASASGLVRFVNERGLPTTLTLNEGLEVRAGSVPFRTTRGLDVLPIEERVYFKRKVERPELLEHYKMLYAAQTVAPPITAVDLYETEALSATGAAPEDAIDRSFWIALLARPTEKGSLDAVRRQLAGRTLSLGVVPSLSSEGTRLGTTGSRRAEGAGSLRVFLPKPPPGGLLPDDPGQRQAAYEALSVRDVGDVLEGPGIVEVSLPSDPAALELWSNLHPLEHGVGDFPPALTDSEQADRLITWLRVRAPVPLLWMGINAVGISQRARVVGEALPSGNGEPDQRAKLALSPVPKTVRITVTPSLPEAIPEVWEELDDLLAAGPEVPAPDPRLPPGAKTKENLRVKVFAVDAEAGEVRFGDGLRGARPPTGASIRADYDFGVGKAGNVGAGAIDTGPALPSGWTVSNPVPTWGGADAEAVSAAEKQVPRYLQHRERLVSSEDFEALALRTPGVDVARVDVLPAFHPDLGPNLPGDAAGVVTLLVLPRSDATHPEAPRPDRRFLDAVACWLDPRRLVTTELILRGPSYVPIQLSVGIEVIAGFSAATARESVKQSLMRFLSPLPPPGASSLDERTALLSIPALSNDARGWPLGKPVMGLELQAVASRVPGVQFVHPLRIFKVLSSVGGVSRTQLVELDPIPLQGLELPHLVAIEVAVGQTPPSFEDTGTVTPAATVPVPVIPEECR